MTILERMARAIASETVKEWPYQELGATPQQHINQYWREWLPEAITAITTLRDTFPDPVVKAALSSVLEEGA